jgi:hypothetical protein
MEISGFLPRIERRPAGAAATRDRSTALWGLHCIPRYPEDDPHIVEVWL